MPRPSDDQEPKLFTPGGVVALFVACIAMAIITQFPAVVIPCAFAWLLFNWLGWRNAKKRWERRRRET